MPLASNYTNVTIAVTGTKMDENELNSSAPAKLSCSELETRTLCLFGESSLTIADKMASTAPSLETRGHTNHQTLSDKLTQSLIFAGLVKGIIPTSIRKQSGARMRDTVFWSLDGDDAEKPKAD